MGSFQELGFPVPMAVDDDAEKPPPARIVVVVRALVPFMLAPMFALARVVLVAGRALPYLCFAIAWVLSGICGAMIVAHLAWGDGSAPFVFLLALLEVSIRVCSTFILLALAAVLLCSWFLEFASGSGSETEKSAFEAIMEESTRGLFRYFHIVILGLVTDLAFFLLIVTGILVMMVASPVEGSISQGETIGSVIVDVGSLGIQAISCFVICPAMVLSVRSKDQADGKEPSQFC